ncbi:hypothetical protein MMC30_003327 [Trapelia coarctata]|nr:hypothetical protein [Trapelia coarctata]
MDSVTSMWTVTATGIASAAPTMASDENAMSSNFLTTDGYNMSNATDQMAFVEALLDDSDFIHVEMAYSAYFWYGIVVVIGIATFINFSSKLTLRARLRAATVNRPFPAKPANPYTKFQAFLTAVVREVTYPQYIPMKFASVIRTPPMGVFLLLTLYFGFLVSLELVQDFIPGALHYQAFGLRAGWLSTTQLPLLILLVGKRNLLALFTGISHERLNIFHRWVARSIWFYGTLHWAFMQYAWTKYGVAKLEISTDPAYPTGIAAWAVLTWICFSSAAPLRNWKYEFFVLQHILSFIGFIVVILLHIPAKHAKMYVYIPIAFYLFDRLVRGVLFAYYNSRLGRATITALPGGVSKVRIQSLRLKNWHAGQHVLLSVPRFGILQSHPATILSTPTSHNGDLIYFVQELSSVYKRDIKAVNSEPLNLKRPGRDWPAEATKASCADIRTLWVFTL